MNKNEDIPTLQSICGAIISLCGLFVLLYFSFMFVQVLGYVIYGLSSEGFLVLYLISAQAVSFIGLLVGILMIRKSDWISQLVISSGGETSVDLGYPTVFLRVSLILLSILVLFMCLPPAIIEFIRYIGSFQNEPFGPTFGMFRTGDYMTNFLRSAFAVLILLYNRQIASWSIGTG